MRSSWVSISLVMVLLSGCVAGPDHIPPTLPLNPTFAEGRTLSNGNTATIAWWRAFADSRLDGYLQQGVRENLDVQRAIERINAAQAQVVIAGAGGLPGLTGSVSNRTSGAASSERATDTSTTNVSSAGLDASWLVDFFGLYKRSKESAQAELDASYADADVARLTLLSQVASAYIDLRYYQERLELTRQSLQSRRETLELTKLQLEAGAASRLDVAQAEGLVNSTLAEAPGLETEFLRAAHRIATLLGQPASSLVPELRLRARQPVPRISVDAGIPADLIRNRPDIRAAERRLASAVAAIGVAEAQLYPSITLGGSISTSYLNSSSAGGTRSLSWAFGPALNLPILDGGRLNANVDLATSTAQQSYLAWKAAVLSAVEQVENALAAVIRDGRTVAALRKTVRSNQEALGLATSTYRDGASSLLDVLDAQRQVSIAQAELAQAIQRMAQNYVALNVAVGGGYAAVDTKPSDGVQRLSP